MATNFKPSHPWLIKNAPTIKSKVQSLIQNSDFFIDINVPVQFSVIKAEKLDNNIRNNLSASDDNNIAFGVLPDVLLPNSININIENTSNPNFFYDFNNFTLYINIYSKTLKDQHIVKGESYKLFLRSIENPKGERLRLSYTLFE